MFRSFLRTIAAFLIVIQIHDGYGSYNTCEKRDGDCDPCPNITESLNLALTTNLSTNQELVLSAKKMDSIINSTDSSDVLTFDNPNFDLHMSLTYTCCHSVEQLDKMLKLLETFEWYSIDLNFTQFACNLDMHNNKTIYLHAMPNWDGEDQLFELVGELYDHWRENGIIVNHPRKSYFHMTLATVNHSYPVDSIINQYQNYNFGFQTLCTFGGVGYSTVAIDCV